MSFLGAAVTCLALNLYHEARGEGPEGMLAVGVVTLNRAAHPDWPDNICDVVYQPHQFSWTRHDPPIHNEVLWNEAQSIAEALLLDDPDSPLDHRALWYHAAHVSPAWADHKEVLGRIGQHVFYGRPETAQPLVPTIQPLPRPEM